MDEVAYYICPHCGESIQLSIDPSAGAEQTYTEDCPVCCSPNLMQVHFDRFGNGEVHVRAE